MFRLNRSYTAQMLNKEVLRAVHTLHGKSHRQLSKFFNYERPSLIIKGEVGESELKRTISNDTN